MGADLDLDDAVSGHPLAERELAELRDRLEAARRCSRRYEHILSAYMRCEGDSQVVMRAVSHTRRNTFGDFEETKMKDFSDWERVSVEELQERFDEYMERAIAGSCFIITRGGEDMAVLIPYGLFGDLKRLSE